MRLSYLDERPSALPAHACAPAHVHHVGHLTLLEVPAGWRGQQEQSVEFIQQLTQQQLTQRKSVQLQEPKVRIQGISGPMAKATGMVDAPFSGVDASGVPPRGRPV